MTPDQLLQWRRDRRLTQSALTLICPACGGPLRHYGRGATLRKHGDRYLCPDCDALWTRADLVAVWHAPTPQPPIANQSITDDDLPF